MRFRQRALLGILLVLAFSFLSFTDDSHGQTSQIDSAQTGLVQAFALVQQADLDGAPPDQIALLAANLNQALDLERNATQLYPTDPALSNYYASKSASLSNDTATAALSLSSNVRRQAFFDQIGTYTIAVAAGLGLALLVMELPLLDDLVRRMRLHRNRFE
jgi:hypothetical protein